MPYAFKEFLKFRVCPKAYGLWPMAYGNHSAKRYDYLFISDIFCMAFSCILREASSTLSFLEVASPR